MPRLTDDDRTYKGPALPEAYNPNWQLYTNLTKEQVRFFQSTPEDLTHYAREKRWHKEIEYLDADGIKLDMTDRGQMRLLSLASDAEHNNAIHFLDANGAVHALNGEGVTKLVKAASIRRQRAFSALSDLLSGIKAKSITSRAQIDEAFSRIP